MATWEQDKTEKKLGHNNNDTSGQKKATRPELYIRLNSEQHYMAKYLGTSIYSCRTSISKHTVIHMNIDHVFTELALCRGACQAQIGLGCGLKRKKKKKETVMPQHIETFYIIVCFKLCGNREEKKHIRV